MCVSGIGSSMAMGIQEYAAQKVMVNSMANTANAMNTLMTSLPQGQGVKIDTFA